MQVKPKSTTGFICTRAPNGYLDRAGQHSTRAAESSWRFGVIHQLSSLRRMAETIKAAPTLASLFDPRPLDPAALFEAIEQRIERVEVHTKRPRDCDSISLPSS
jgi:hypothetical protein